MPLLFLPLSTSVHRALKKICSAPQYISFPLAIKEPWNPILLLYLSTTLATVIASIFHCYLFNFCLSYRYYEPCRIKLNYLIELLCGILSIYFWGSGPYSIHPCVDNVDTDPVSARSAMSWTCIILAMWHWPIGIWEQMLVERGWQRQRDKKF
jgi:hypothetical protein